MHNDLHILSEVRGRVIRITEFDADASKDVEVLTICKICFIYRVFGRECGAYGGGERCAQGFGGEA
jgi:hypothetical protein